MPRLLIASNNEGKVAELRRLLDGCGWELVTPAELGLKLSADETGETYAENAALKAQDGARASGLVTMGEDSGIEIQAMGGEPGVRSARFLGEDAGFEERFVEILRRLEGLPSEKRWARFRAVIAIAAPGSNDVRLFEGEVRGIIAREPQGESGFGYDPIFYVPQRLATMAELPPHEKDIISHRGRAAMRARPALKELPYERERADVTS